jgi:hypothetical protein
LADGAPSGELLEAQMATFFGEFERLETTPAARAPDLFTVTREDGFWQVGQVLMDPDDTRTFVLRLRVPLDASREANAPVLELVEIGR